MQSAKKILCKGTYYGVQGTVAFLLTGCTLSTTFLIQTDKHLLSPWRNYHYTLADKNHFIMPEDFCQFGTNLRKGLCNFVTYTASGFSKPQ